MEGETLEQNVNKQMLQKAISVLRDKKALNAKIVEVFEHCSFADYFIFVSATSKTHAQAISDELQRLVKRNSQPEGYDTGQWILNDLGDIIVHVFLEETRGFYQLDKLWAHAPTVEIDFEHEQHEFERYSKASTL